MESLAALVARLEGAVLSLEQRLGSVDAEAPPSSSLQQSSSLGDARILEYDELVAKSFEKVVAAAIKTEHNKVVEGTNMIKDALVVHRDILLKFNNCKQPDMQGLTELIRPLSELIQKANALTEGRRTDTTNHFKTIAECLPALLWVAYTGKDCGLSLPAVHVEEMWQSAEFFNNKVMIEYKSKDSDHVDWAKALKEFFMPGLRDYVRKNYPMGPTWNPSGVDVKQSDASSSSSIPTPPKPIPQATPSLTPPSGPLPVSAEGPRAAMGAVFQEISKGETVTSGLKKVTDDLKTKNRPDRQSVVTAGSGRNTTGSSGRAFSKEGPPKLELQMGRRWVVENQIGKKSLVIDDCNSKQSVYIFGCKDSVVQVQGKVNNITIDKCMNTGVVFVDVVAACEIVNCNGIEVQCQGTVPTIAIDNTASCQLYLSRSSMGASITTAKSSAVNVLVPGAADNHDMVEHSLPEQFSHVFKNGQFITCPVSHSGA